jgi:hypothetical protein
VSFMDILYRATAPSNNTLQRPWAPDFFVGTSQVGVRRTPSPTSLKSWFAPSAMSIRPRQIRRQRGHGGRPGSRGETGEGVRVTHSRDAIRRHRGVEWERLAGDRGEVGCGQRTPSPGSRRVPGRRARHSFTNDSR